MPGLTAEAADKLENEEPVGALLPRREFMGIPSKYMQIFIPMAVVLLVLAILLAK